ncbi:MAG: hypothetical protein MJ158_02015 [Alphaproteobacteria bacterium]|nr:hypothetical protein [Alphaproteobacteria bacterium]
MQIKTIKKIIKICVAVVLITTLVLLTVWTIYSHRKEKSNMQKWSEMSIEQKNNIVNRFSDITIEQHTVMIACMDKISTFTDSDTMIIKDALSLCYHGLKMNIQIQDEK